MLLLWRSLLFFANWRKYIFLFWNQTQTHPKKITPKFSKGSNHGHLSGFRLGYALDDTQAHRTGGQVSRNGCLVLEGWIAEGTVEGIPRIPEGQWPMNFDMLGAIAGIWEGFSAHRAFVTLQTEVPVAVWLKLILPAELPIADLALEAFEGRISQSMACHVPFEVIGPIKGPWTDVADMRLRNRLYILPVTSTVLVEISGRNKTEGATRMTTFERFHSGVCPGTLQGT